MPFNTKSVSSTQRELIKRIRDNHRIGKPVSNSCKSTVRADVKLVCNVTGLFITQPTL